MRNVTHSGMHVCEFRIDTTDYFLVLFSSLRFRLLLFLLLELLKFGFFFWICFAFFCTTLWVSRTRLPRHRCPFASCTYIGLTPKPYSHYTATGLGCTLPRSPIPTWTLLLPRVHLGSAPTANRLGFEGHPPCALRISLFPHESHIFAIHHHPKKTLLSKISGLAIDLVSDFSKLAYFIGQSSHVIFILDHVFNSLELITRGSS